MTDAQGDPLKWDDYFKASARKPAHATSERGMAALSESWARMPAVVRVLDLGSGSGRDALHFLSRGWRVTAIDSHAAALGELKQRAAEAKLSERLEITLERFEKLEIPPASFDFINASMALPWCEPASFKELWAKIRAGLKEGGVFAGHLFGKHDEWASRQDMTFLWQSELEGMLMGLEVVHLSEHELDRATPLGEMKHWHYFEVVARKHGP